MADSLTSCIALHPILMGSQYISSTYDLVFTDDIPQNGTIVIGNDTGYNYVISSSGDKSFVETSGNITIEYSIPSSVEGYSVVAPNQVLLSFNKDATISEREYSHFVFIGESDSCEDIINAINLLKIDGSHYLITFEGQLCSEGQLITDIADKAGNIKPTRSEVEEFYLSSNYNNLSIQIENPWLYLERAEYIDDYTARIYFSDKSKFQTGHPEEHICLLNVDGSCVYSESVIAVDGNINYSASVYDVKFPCKIQHGAICIIDKKTQRTQSNLDTIICSTNGKSLFAGYEYSHENEHFILSYIEYHPPVSVERPTEIYIPDIHITQIEIIDPANLLVRLVFSEPVHINNNFALIGNCGSYQWATSLDEQVAPIYESGDSIEGYSFSKSVVVKLCESESSGTTNDIELLSQTASFNFEIPDNTIVGVYDNRFFTNKINEEVSVSNLQDVYAALINIQAINSKQIELTYKLSIQSKLN